MVLRGQRKGEHGLEICLQQVYCVQCNLTVVQAVLHVMGQAVRGQMKSHSGFAKCDLSVRGVGMEQSGTKPSLTLVVKGSAEESENAFPSK